MIIDYEAVYRQAVRDLAAIGEAVGNTNGGPDVTLGIVRELVAVRVHAEKAEARVAELERWWQNLRARACTGCGEPVHTCDCSDEIRERLYGPSPAITADSVGDTKENHDAKTDVVAASDARVHQSAMRSDPVWQEPKGDTADAAARRAGSPADAGRLVSRSVTDSVVSDRRGQNVAQSAGEGGECGALETLPGRVNRPSEATRRRCNRGTEGCPAHHGMGSRTPCLPMPSTPRSNEATHESGTCVICKKQFPVLDAARKCITCASEWPTVKRTQEATGVTCAGCGNYHTCPFPERADPRTQEAKPDAGGSSWSERQQQLEDEELACRFLTHIAGGSWSETSIPAVVELIREVRGGRPDKAPTEDYPRNESYLAGYRAAVSDACDVVSDIGQHEQESAVMHALRALCSTKDGS